MVAVCVRWCVVYVVRTAFRGRQPALDGQTGTVQTNRILSVVNLSAVHWHGTELKLTARQISKKEQNSSVRRRQPVRCRWLGTVLEFTARQIQSKRTEFSPSSTCPLSTGMERTELKLTARQISKKEQNSSVRRRQPVRCRWLGTVLEFTARQISEKEQNLSVRRQPVRCPLAWPGRLDTSL